MTCEKCGGAVWSEFDYPHHLVEGLDACLCEEKPVSEEQMISSEAYAKAMAWAKGCGVSEESLKKYSAEVLALIASDTCRTCKERPATTEYTRGWRVCESCSRSMSQ